MSERPISFSGPMVRAILDGTKTQTRRVLVPQPDASLDHFKGRTVDRFRGVGVTVKSRRAVFEAGDSRGPIDAFRDGRDSIKADVDCPYGAIGGRLWVRETWADTNGESGPMISYRAGGDRFLVDESYPVDYSRYPNCTFAMWGGDLRRGAPDHAWRSPIHMPRWASRITLELTDVCVERLQDISEIDAIYEGVESQPNPDYRDGDDPWTSARLAVHVYRELWDSLNAKRGYGWDVNPWVWALSFRVVAPSSSRETA